MKIAIVWNFPSRLLDCSFRFEQYLAGFRALGHEPVIVCTEASAEGGGFDAPIVTVPTAETFQDVAFWKDVNAETALITTWLRMPDVLRAIRESGTRVVAISDSDGQAGMLAFPRAGFERLMVYRDGPLDTLRRLKFFAARQLLDRRRGTDEDRMALESARQSDVLTICHQVGIECFQRFLARYGAEDLMERVRRVPFTIGDSFLACAVPETKEDRVVTIGRWADPQKNTPLLARTIRHFLDQRPQTEVVVYGAGGERWLKPLEERYPSFTYAGVQHQEVVARALASSRSFLGTARWESGPMVVTEALALGATIVGVPIPSYQSYAGATAGGGPYGRIAVRRSPRALADALVDEMAAWDHQERSSQEISEHWKREMQPEVLCRRLLA